MLAFDVSLARKGIEFGLLGKARIRLPRGRTVSEPGEGFVVSCATDVILLDGLVSVSQRESHGATLVGSLNRGFKGWLAGK